MNQYPISAAATNPFSLQGRTVLVTGSTQGVGSAIAKACADAGADLVIHGLIRDDHAQATEQYCLARGSRVDFLGGDLLPADKASDISSHIHSIFQQALAVNPAIDSLVNNAGTYREGQFNQLSPAAYYHTWQLNVSVGLFLTQFFARHWIASGQGGRVLFTGSINGLLAEQEHVAYDTSKGAVAAMVRSLCTELAPHGIRVNSVAPGLVVTPMTSIVESNHEFNAWMRLHTPNGQVPHAAVCGPPAVFLLSDAAMHIHGQTLYVDGGMSAWQQPNPPAKPSEQ
jgi:NAD(P)-dependent dehydrogenase (short-subunit alcohol dehydrogenase family)